MNVTRSSNAILPLHKYQTRQFRIKRTYKGGNAFTEKIITHDTVLIVKRASIHELSIHNAVQFNVFYSGINVGQFIDRPSMVLRLQWVRKTMIPGARNLW
jgi:hypothetical protein